MPREEDTVLVYSRIIRKAHDTHTSARRASDETQIRVLKALYAIHHA